MAGPDPQHRRGGKWDSLLPLPKPYVVPGGRFREVYYWDSYFTNAGLAESGHWDKVEDMVANFAAKLTPGAHIPNGNRTYYLSRSQPPFFSFMVSLLATHDGDQVLKTYQPQLEGVSLLDGRSGRAGPGSADKRAVRMADGALLNRYWDDNDTPRPESWLTTSKPPKATRIVRQPRSIATCAPPPPPAGISAPAGWINPQQLATIRTTSIVPVDLNALMFHLRKPSPAPARHPGTAPALRSTMRWLMPASRPSRNICGMIKR